MAYLVRRRNGSWEIRESRQTDRGPRSFTLATFREDTPEIRSKVLDRSRIGLLESELERKLDEAGVPPAMTDADQAARDLLVALAGGIMPSDALRRSLLKALAVPSPSPDSSAIDEPRDDVAQGRILEDVLDLAQELPYRPGDEIAQRPLRDLVTGSGVA